MTVFNKRVFCHSAVLAIASTVLAILIYSLDNNASSPTIKNTPLKILSSFVFFPDFKNESALVHYLAQTVCLFEISMWFVFVCKIVNKILLELKHVIHLFIIAILIVIFASILNYSE